MLFKSYGVDKSLRPAAAYETVQKHKVTPGIPGWLNLLVNTRQGKPEQLKRLRSDNTPRRPMIIHTIDSYWIQSKNKTKSNL